MLELYHSVNSVCAQKVRVALWEKQQPYTDRTMTLRGDQFEPAYLKLNPNGVVPTLVHDGKPVIESSVILYYLEDAFPDRSMMPSEPLARARTRMFNKLIDEYVHNSCMVITFATAFRPALLRVAREERNAQFAKSPIKRRAEIKRDVVDHGLDSAFVAEALAHHAKMLSWMEEALAHGPFLAGEAFSVADAAVVPYVIRLDLLRLNRMWDQMPGVASWWDRIRQRPSVQKEIYDRMTDDDWKPFKEFQPDPWSKVHEIMVGTH
jgi:glutathione S-transferase